jgi:hypothetical protein
MENMMKEMMKNFGSFASPDFAKNFGSFASPDFAKNFGSFKEFDAAKISRQALDFQKSAFDKTFDAMLKIQDQSSSMTASLIGGNKFLPEEGRKMLEEWSLSLRENQFEFKKKLDDNFSQFMSLLAPETSEPESKSAKSSESEPKTASKAAK